MTDDERIHGSFDIEYAIFEAGMANPNPLNIPSTFFSSGDKHPLDHRGSTVDGWNAEHSRIVERIRCRLGELSLTSDNLAPKLPNSKGGLGVSPRRARQIVSKPETATAKQVEALCRLLNCSLDYLRASETEPHRIIGVPEADDMVEMFNQLTNDEKTVVYKVICAFVKTKRPLYPMLYQMKRLNSLMPIEEIEEYIDHIFTQDDEEPMKP